MIVVFLVIWPNIVYVCLLFFPDRAGVDINSYRIVFRNFFLLELICACLNNDMKLRP